MIAHRRVQRRNLTVWAKGRLEQAERIQLLKPTGIIPVALPLRTQAEIVADTHDDQDDGWVRIILRQRFTDEATQTGENALF